MSGVMLRSSPRDRFWHPDKILVVKVLGRITKVRHLDDSLARSVLEHEHVTGFEVAVNYPYHELVKDNPMRWEPPGGVRTQ